MTVPLLLPELPVLPELLPLLLPLPELLPLELPLLPPELLPELPPELLPDVLPEPASSPLLADDAQPPNGTMRATARGKAPAPRAKRASVRVRTTRVADEE